MGRGRTSKRGAREKKGLHTSWEGELGGRVGRESWEGELGGSVGREWAAWCGRNVCGRRGAGGVAWAA
eukprot:2351912-Prymnesium_polylepis.1